MRVSPRLLGALVGVGLFATSALAHALTVDQIIAMHEAQVPSNIIVSTIQSSETVFHLTPEEIIALNSAGVTPDVITAMQETAGASEGAGSGGRIEEPEDEEPRRREEDEPRRRMDDEEDEPRRRVEDEDEGDDDDGMIRTRRRGDDEDGGSTRSSSRGSSRRSRPPEVVRELIDAYQARRYPTASANLYKLLEEDRYPDHAVRMQYYLADSLFKMGMFHSAQNYFVEVVRNGEGTSFYGPALIRLSSIADEIGDDTTMLRLIPGVDEDEYPGQAESALFYYAGKRAFLEEDFSLAQRLLEQVSERDSKYMPALYMQGVINHQQERLRAAYTDFLNIVREGARIDNPSEEVRDLVDLALINLARIRYNIGQFAEAEENYLKVPRDSNYWVLARFELAWSHFHQEDGQNEALGQVMTVSAPFFRQVSWVPEVDLLEAFTYYQLCEFDRVATLLTDFDETYSPVLGELDRLLEPYREREAEPEEAYQLLYGSRSDYDDLPAGLFSRVERNNRFAGPHRHVLAIEDEIALINAQRANWRDHEVGRGLLRQLREDRDRYARRAGGRLINQLNSVATELRELMGQRSLLEFEVVNGEYERYRDQFRDPTLALVDERIELSFATNPRYVFWPYNGEFWDDELGWYRFTETGSCNQ